MLACVDLRKAAFAYLGADDELTNDIVAHLGPTGGRAGRGTLFGHGVRPVILGCDRNPEVVEARRLIKGSGNDLKLGLSSCTPPGP